MRSHACSISIGAVTLYVRRAAAHGWDWPLPDELDNATLEARLFPRAAAIRDRPPPAFAEIHRELARTGVTLQLLWEEYAQVYPEGYRYSQFCVLYRQWARRLRPSMRQVHRAGEKTFIDFSGKRPTVVDRRTGEVRSVELFVAVLGASSYTYAEATATQQLPDWVGAHTRMVEYFGGTTALWAVPLPDRVGTRPGSIVPMKNWRALRGRGRAGPPGQAKRQSRRRVRGARGATMDPRAAPRPDFLQSRRAECGHLGPAPRPERPPPEAAGHDQLDRPALRPLPTCRYVLAEWKPCRVSIDYHIQVDRHLYSVPTHP